VTVYAVVAFKSVKNRLFCHKKNINLEWNTQAASYNFLRMYPGHEPAKFCDNPFKTYQFECLMNHFYDRGL